MDTSLTADCTDYFLRADTLIRPYATNNLRMMIGGCFITPCFVYPLSFGWIYTPSVRRSRPIGGGLGRGPHLASSPICLAFFFSSSMSASRSLGTRLSSTASLRHCFSAPTSMPGLRWNISMISLPLMHGCRSRL